MPENNKLWFKRFGIFALIVLIIGGVTLYVHFSHFESTDDAFIDAHIIPISPKVAGQVLAVHVNDNQAVKAGEALLEIDSRDYDAKVAEERGKLDAADAEARRAGADALRYEKIFRQDEISRQQLDHAQAPAAAAQANLAKEHGAL